MALSPAGKSTISSVTSSQQLLQIGGKIDRRTPEDLAIIFGRGQFVGTMGRDLPHARAYREGHLDQIVERRLIARGAESAIILRAIQGLQAFVGGENTGAARAHHVPCHLEHAEPHRIQQRRDDPLLVDVGLGREIKRIHLVQGMIRGIPHHTLEHVDDAFVGRLTQGHKQGLGFAHATMLHERRSGGNPPTHHFCCTETLNPRVTNSNRRTIWLAMAFLPAKAADYGPLVRPTRFGPMYARKGQLFASAMRCVQVSDASSLRDQSGSSSPLASPPHAVKGSP